MYGHFDEWYPELAGRTPFGGDESRGASNDHILPNTVSLVGKGNTVEPTSTRPIARTLVLQFLSMRPVPRLPTSFLLGLLLTVGLLAGCRQTRPTTGPSGPEVGPLPEIPREFRAAWIATVANIDWPSEPGLPVETQKEELRRMLDRADALNLNAVIFQVRPHADALYDSPHEPWSFYLTGEQGRAPSPSYDPLAFAIEEAHTRGLELHAWFNPYRAGHPADTSAVAPSHLANRHPSWVHEYGEYLWLDPGLPEVQDHTHRVIMDVVRRYDVDGVHFDDYFYPYPSYDDGSPFPDSTSWTRARETGWTGTRGDWRRHNVNLLVERVYRSIKETKPHVKFGISPFGIWRPDHPPGTTGFDAYTQLYADARKWLREGWVDYLTPQLYYRLDQFGHSYPEMLRWWSEQNDEDRHIWPGLYTSRVAMDGDSHWSDRQLLGQIYTARSHPAATGQVHFSMKALMPLPDSVQRAESDSTVLAPVYDTLTVGSVIVQERAVDSIRTDTTVTDRVSIVQTKPAPRALRSTHRLQARLRSEAYGTPAVIPASPWLTEKSPSRPRLSVRGDGPQRVVTWTPTGPESVHRWVVRRRTGNSWAIDVLPGEKQTLSLPIAAERAHVDAVVISAVNRFGHIGPPASVRLDRPTE